MTLRRILLSTVLAGAIATGTIALPVVALAAPAPVYVAPRTQSARATSALASTFGSVDYVDARDGLAAEVAFSLGLDAEPMQQAWARADQAHQTALLAAFSQVGVPYHRNTSAPGVGFDCSGLTSYAWAQAGLDIAHQSASQIRAAAPRTKDTAQAGDLVYYPGHVMLYLGVDAAIIHSPYTGRTVEASLLSPRRFAKVKFGDPVS